MTKYTMALNDFAWQSVDVFQRAALLGPVGTHGQSRHPQYDNTWFVTLFAISPLALLFN
jgi:hypothetical protein